MSLKNKDKRNPIGIHSFYYYTVYCSAKRTVSVGPTTARRRETNQLNGFALTIAARQYGFGRDVKLSFGKPTNKHTNLTILKTKNILLRLRGDRGERIRRRNFKKYFKISSSIPSGRHRYQVTRVFNRSAADFQRGIYDTIMKRRCTYLYVCTCIRVCVYVCGIRSIDFTRTVTPNAR